jgi:4-amino-4-deoxy-L-arabinose transferase-like glycosyltransferase
MDTMTFETAPAAPGLTSGTDRPARLGTALSPRLTRLWRGEERDPRWARPAFLGLLLATAVLYFWDLTASGYANSFYSAAAQAGSASWKAFFYGASDAAGSITVDKPPASLWLMALSVRIFGLSSFAILLPEVLMGIGTVALVHATVRRHFSAAAGLIAGAVMALTPVAVLMFRYNNPDALLVLLMALGAWATLRSIERGSVRWMVVTGVFIGLGFLTKTLQVMLVVPFFGLAYLLLANTTLRRRIVGSLAAVASMVLSAGWWVAVVELVPASLRPYVGGSQDNSFLSLTFGYNGFGRLDGSEEGSVGGRGPNSGTGSLWRMFSDSIGGQISWLIPTAVVFLVAGLWLRGRMPRTDARRAAYVVWGGWLLVTGLTFSLMQGIFHEYYTVALAPAVAALVGMGAVEAWERRASILGRFVLAGGVAVAAVWSFELLGRTTAYGEWLRVLVLAVGITAAAGLLVLDRVHSTAVPVLVGASLVAGLAGPTAYSLTTVATPHTGSIVTAGPSTGGMGGPGGALRGGFAGGMPGGATQQGGAGPQGGITQQGGPTTRGGAGGMGGLLDATPPSTEVVAALTADASDYTWVAATVGSQNAAGLQLATQLPVMAIGGFNGSDPSPTLAQFQQYVADGEIHYFYGGGGFRGQNGGSSSASDIAAWVQDNFTATQIGGQTFYDLTQPLPSGSTGSSSSTTQTT